MNLTSKICTLFLLKAYMMMLTSQLLECLMRKFSSNNEITFDQDSARREFPDFELYDSPDSRSRKLSSLTGE